MLDKQQALGMHEFVLDDDEVRLLIEAIDAWKGEFDTGREDWSKVDAIRQVLEFAITF